MYYGYEFPCGDSEAKADMTPLANPGATIFNTTLGNKHSSLTELELVTWIDK